MSTTTMVLSKFRGGGVGEVAARGLSIPSFSIHVKNQVSFTEAAVFNI